MLTLFVALMVGQVAPDSTVKWRDLSNQPGWQGYGPVLPSGWVDPVKFRRKDNPKMEYPAAGKEKEFVLSEDAKLGTNVAMQQPNQTVQTTLTDQPTQVAQPVQMVNQPTADPYGFTAWLNATRAAYGLPAVGYDPNLASWAAMNSAQQAVSGLGHFVMGSARRQNSAAGSFPGIESMWMASPAHRAALLDPSIQWIGIAASGAYWTFNAY
jgi:uncharacterized protein YkwD